MSNRLGWLVAVLLLAASVPARAQFTPLESAVARVESALPARVGVLVRHTGSGQRWAHRADERFLMNSTVKTLVCGAVLEAVDTGRLSLDAVLPVAEADLIAHAPLTADHVGERLAVAELCRAAVDLSDNTATNLLMAKLGGPAAITAFLRRIGDAQTRVDRMEPELNTWAAGDPRDTTTPTAMLATLEALLLGDALAPASRARLRDWMRPGSYTGNFLRAAAPRNWVIADKSGAGPVTRTLVALVTPPGEAPWLVGIFISEANVDFAARNRALRDIAAAVVAALDASEARVSQAG